MILYCPHTGPRVAYMAQWLGNHLFGTPMQVYTQQDWEPGSAVLNYSDTRLEGTYQVKPQGLLFENGVRNQILIVDEAGKIPCFFQTEGDHPFDLLAGAFYLLSRYEEYLPHEKDMYGRYAHENSLAFKHGFLKRPLVDEWMLDLKQRLSHFFPSIVFAEKRYQFLPTYDVDMAWSYLEKGWLRNLLGYGKQLLKGDWKGLSERRRVLAGAMKDPFDVFDDLDELHAKYDLKPIYFILLAEEKKGYDKNISPRKELFQQLVQRLGATYDSGIHLSWQSFNEPAIMQSEKCLLETITGRAVLANRFHYVKFDLPQSYRQLIDLGITKDHSMGYGSINGFRSSTCTPFSWYDLEKEETTPLLVFPFCYMEANSIFEQKDDPETALADMRHYDAVIRKTGGMFITLFHNHLVGRDAEGRKWWKPYEEFLSFYADNLAKPQSV